MKVWRHDADTATTRNCYSSSMSPQGSSRSPYGDRPPQPMLLEQQGMTLFTHGSARPRRADGCKRGEIRAPIPFSAFFDRSRLRTVVAAWPIWRIYRYGSSEFSHSGKRQRGEAYC